MIPDLPMPVRMTRPRHCFKAATALSNFPSSRGMSARIAAASVSSTFLASDKSATLGDLAALHERVDGPQTRQQRLEKIEPERVLRIALRRGGVVVHFEKHAID